MLIYHCAITGAATLAAAPVVLESLTTTRAGFPRATAYGGISVMTTLLTPMVAPSRIGTSARLQDHGHLR